MTVTVTATAEPTTGRVRIVASGGAIRTPLYVFRRDSAGVGVVRDTSAGTVLWPPVGPPVAVNLIGNGDFAAAGAAGAPADMAQGTIGRAVRDTAHPAAGGAGWSARIVWGASAYPAVNRYPSGTTHPREV